MFHVLSAWGRLSSRCSAVVMAVLLSVPAVGAAQTITGQISGRVTDCFGRCPPGRDRHDRQRRHGIQGYAGHRRRRRLHRSRTFASAPTRSRPSCEGFRKEQRTGFSLTADGRLSADFSLGVGEVSEAVEVTAVMGETVNRTNGEVARTIDSQQIKDLAFNGRNYLELASLIPGAVATDYDPLALATSLSVTGQSINGSRGNTNNLTVDGASNLDSGSNGSQVNNVSLSFIDQVKIQTSNFSAELGRNSGAAINVVTRSGTNRLQGTARYDFRDEKFDEPNYFAARDANGNRTKPELEFRNFEGALGGPVLRNKLFFFGGQQYRIINRFTNPSRQTMPTRAELAGDFAFRLRGTDNIVGTADDGVLRDPTTGQQFPGNVIPSDRITTDGRAIANTYAKMIDLAAEYTEHADREQRDLPAVQPLRAAAGHHPHRLAGDRQPARPRTVSPRRVRPARSVRRRSRARRCRPCRPTGRVPAPAIRSVTPGWSARTWSTRLASARRGTASGSTPRATPGSATTYGYQFPELFDGRLHRPAASPTSRVTGFPNLIGPSFALLSPTTDITFQDTLTYTRGRHSIRSGVAISRNRKDQNGRAAYLGDVSLQRRGKPEQHQQRAGGRAARQLPDVQRGVGRPGGLLPLHRLPGVRVGHLARALEPEPRGRPALRVRAADLRAGQQPRQLRSVALRPVTGGDGAAQRPAGRRTRATGSTASSWRATACPRISRAASTLLTGGDYSRIPNGAPRGLYDAQHLFMPRASFAYSLNEATVIRGGVGVFYDKPEGNVIFSQLNIPPILDNVTYENFNLAAPSSGAAGAIGALGDINALDPNLKLARQINFSARRPAGARSAATSSRRRMSATAATSCCASPTSTAPASTPCGPTRRCRPRSACRPTSCAPTGATRRSGCA